MDWIPRTTEPQPADGEAFQRECGFSEPFFRVLWRRGIRTRDQAELFLHPERQPLPDPTALLDMDRAAALIKSAIAAEKKICIYGDYDVDGVCATTILYQTLATLGADVSYYIPLRAGEGYGMHAESVRQIAESGVQLLITVDNGISAHAEIALANSLGMKVIVTDHHRCHETLPDALAIVCASREGQAEEIRSLCGGAVALLLAIALGQPAERFLAIAALATVADVMPLTGFNRTIVARGIRLIHREPGLQALLDAAGAGDNAVTEMTLSFLLAPRINAAGRMGDARRAVELLLASDDSARRHYAAELDAANAARKSEEQRILIEAERQIDPSVPHLLLMLRGEDWNPGVIGIVASRLLEKYGCPVLLFTRLGDELAGSGRSVPQVDLFGLLAAHAEHFTRFGGHLLAAGAAMKPDAFDACRRTLLDDLARRFPNGLAREPIVYEDTLSVADCTEQFCRELALLAPFGEANHEPLFRLRGTLSDVGIMGHEGKHLSATLTENGHRLRLVGFRFGDRAGALQGVGACEVLCTLKTNTFRDSTSVNGYLSEVRAALPDGLWTAADAFLQEPNAGNAQRVARHADARPNEQEMRAVFIRLRGRLRTGLRSEDLNEIALLTMLVLFESGIVASADGRFFEQVVTEKKQITNGRLYSALHS